MKDRRVMLSKYAAIYAEAEVHFERLRTGRSMSDTYLKTTASAIVPGPIGDHRLELTQDNFRKVVEHRGGKWLDGLSETEKDVLTKEVMKLYADDDLALLDHVQTSINARSSKPGNWSSLPYTQGQSHSDEGVRAGLAPIR